MNEETKHWLELFKEDWFRDNNSLPVNRLNILWKDVERNANQAYKYIVMDIKNKEHQPKVQSD